jgi:hypothetical protein
MRDEVRDRHGRDTIACQSGRRPVDDHRGRGRSPLANEGDARYTGHTGFLRERIDGRDGQ